MSRGSFFASAGLMPSLGNVKTFDLFDLVFESMGSGSLVSEHASLAGAGCQSEVDVTEVGGGVSSFDVASLRFRALDFVIMLAGSGALAAVGRRS